MEEYIRILTEQIRCKKAKDPVEVLLFSFAVWMDWFKIRNRKRFLILFWIGVIAAVPVLVLFLWATGQIAPYQSHRLAAFIGAFKGEGGKMLTMYFYRTEI